MCAACMCILTKVLWMTFKAVFGKEELSLPFGFVCVWLFRSAQL